MFGIRLGKHVVSFRGCFWSASGHFVITFWTTVWKWFYLGNGRTSASIQLFSSFVRHHVLACRNFVWLFRWLRGVFQSSFLLDPFRWGFWH